MSEAARDPRTNVRRSTSIAAVTWKAGDRFRVVRAHKPEVSNLAIVAEAAIQLCETLFECDDVLGICRLKLTQAVLVDVCDLAGANGLEEADQSLALLVPAFRTHGSPRGARTPLLTKAALSAGIALGAPLPR